MSAGSVITNRPVWNTALAGSGAGHQEVWYMKMNAAEAGRALWLRFTLLARTDGSKRVAEVWAIDFRRREDGTVEKTGIKNTFDAGLFLPFETEGVPGFRIGENEFSDARTVGNIASEDHRIAWSFEMRPASSRTFDFVPASAAKLGLVKNTAVTVFEDWRFTGWSEVDGRRFEWQEASGMQGHLSGPKNGHSWAWAHCNLFMDEKGKAAECVFDGLSARVGKSRALPALTSLYLYHQGEEYRFNRLRDALRSSSHYGPESWEFEASQGGITVRGHIRAELTDFAGVTYEDTDGSPLYCHNSKMVDMGLDIFRRGRLVRHLSAPHTVAYEFVTRTKHPDVTFVI